MPKTATSAESTRSIVTSAEWTGIEPQPEGLSGEGTGTLQWGTPVSGNKKSGYSFAGGTEEVPLDGTEFVLGTFRHENHPVRGVPEYSTVGLRIRLEFQDGSAAKDFDFDFGHHETPGVDVDDVVDLPRLHSNETVEIDGKRYALVIKGFQRDGQTPRKLISPENRANEAKLVATIEPAESIAVHTFKVCDPDGLPLGEGRFSYIGPERGIDIEHVCGSSQQGPPLLHWEYKDELVGILTFWDLQSLYFKWGDDGKGSFSFNAFRPGGVTGIATGIVTTHRPGLLWIWRSPERDESGRDIMVMPPTPLPKPNLCPSPQQRQPGPCLSPQEVETRLAQVKANYQRQIDAANQEIERLQHACTQLGGRDPQQQPSDTGGLDLQPTPGPIVEPEGAVPELTRTTSGWLMYHPEWEEYVCVYGWVPNQGNNLRTWNGPFAEAPNQQSWRWLFEETDVKGEYRIRPGATDRTGRTLYATAPPTTGNPGDWWPPAVTSQARRDDQSQIWSVVIESPGDPLSLAILPKAFAGYALAAPWVHNGYLWLNKEPAPVGIEYNRQGLNRWRLRAAPKS